MNLKNSVGKRQLWKNIYKEYDFIYISSQHVKRSSILRTKHDDIIKKEDDKHKIQDRVY